MSDANEGREREIAGRARERFAESVAGLDGRTRSRLARARALAVEAAASRRPWWALAGDARRLVPLSAAAAALLAVLVFWQTPEPAVGPVEANVLDDLDLLLEGENLDLFEELEFYAWLLEQPEMQALADEDDSG
jgi:hypothetical protein